MNRAERLAKDGVGEKYVLFYSPDHDYGVFSNFSAHRIVLPSPWTGKLVEYETSEHRYQAMKADNQEQHDDVMGQTGPGAAKSLGGLVRLRPDWGDTQGSICWYVMLEVLVAKTIQHDEMSEALEESVGHWLYEDSPVDDIWGWRHRQDYHGKNLLGLGLMHTRQLVGIS